MSYTIESYDLKLEKLIELKWNSQSQVLWLYEAILKSANIQKKL